LGNKLIKDVDGGINGSASKSVVFGSFGEELFLIFSDESGFLKGDFIVGETGLGLLKVKFCFLLRGNTGGVLVGSGFQGHLTLSDFSISEGLFFITGCVISLQHFVVLGFFGGNLSLETIK
jgi:hypothetical protein